MRISGWSSDVCSSDLEYREALEERDGARRLAGFRRAPAFVVRREAVGIDDGGAALALADIAAEPERLAAGQPALAGEATLDDGAPEDQDVDPGVDRKSTRLNTSH